MQSKLQNYSNEKGFTLLEMLIATILLSFGLLAYASFSGNLVMQNTKDERKTLAITYAQEKLEDLKNDALDAALATSSSVYPTAHADFTEDPDGAEKDIFTRKWWIVNGGAGNLSILQVEVEWEDINGTQSVFFATMLSQ